MGIHSPIETNGAETHSAKPGQLQRATFSTSRLLDFCSEKELTNLTGHPPPEWPLVVVKELVDNAIDACEGAGIAPVVSVTVDAEGIGVFDNGPGIPAETIKGVLDYNMRVSSREAYVSLTRGAQGNALQTILAMPFVLDGVRGRVHFEAMGLRHTIDFSVDHLQQKPAIECHTAPTVERNGTLVRVEWPVSPRSILGDAEARFLQIADDFTWLNPHLALTTNWFGKISTVQPTNLAWSKWLPSHPTTPHWYETDHLERLIGAYLSADKTTNRVRTVREFISEFRGLTGTQKQKAVLAATGLAKAPLAQLSKGKSFDGVLVADLLAAMQGNSMPVKPQLLGFVGEDHLRQRFKAAGCAMDSFQYRRILSDDDLPTVIEAAFGWRPEDDLGKRLVTGVNWSPGIRNPFRVLGEQSLDGILTRQWVHPDENVVVVLHVARPRIQYTDRGKSAVVLPAAVASKAIDAVELVTKRWAKVRKADDRSETARENRHARMTRRADRATTIKDAAWEIMEVAYLKASANDTLPAHARQIMYAARPYIQEETGRPLDDKYFTQTLLPDYIEQHDRADWNVVFDARGHFHEPHTGHGVPLGTIEIREYLEEVADHRVGDSDFDVREHQYPTRGPQHRYGAILFVEKEGFMPLFNHVQLAERYDIAIMSTKGMSVTASRKLVDTICADHAIPLLVVHDFDKSGFSIVGTQRRDTRRYAFQNKIEVIDVGMRLEDIEGLQAEFFGHKEHGRSTLRR